MPTKRRKITMNISLTKETVDLLTQEAARQDRSRSWIIEWAVKKALAPTHQPVIWDLPGLPPVTCGPSSETTSVEIPTSRERAKSVIVQADQVSATPLTDLQRAADAQAGRYRQLDAAWPDALERPVPPLEFSA